MTARDVTVALAQRGVDVSMSSVYAWERGASAPAPFVLSELAQLYRCEILDFYWWPKDER